MKDSYTLDRDQAGLDEGYALHEVAYDRIFDRCGLTFYKVESDTGMHGRHRARTSTWRRRPRARTRSRCCDRCDYAANVEMAVVAASRSRSSRPRRRPRRSRRRASTTIEALAEFLGDRPAHDRARRCRSSPTTASVVLALVRGDRRLHELKLRKALGQDAPAGHARGDRGGVRREARLDRAGRHPRRRDRRHRGRRDAARGRVRRRARTAPATTSRASCSAATTRPTFADLHDVEDGDGCPLLRRHAARSSRRSRSATSSSSARSYAEAHGRDLPRRGRQGAADRDGLATASARRASWPRRSSSRYDDARLHLAARRSRRSTSGSSPIGDEALVARRRASRTSSPSTGSRCMIDDRAQAARARASPTPT